MTMQELKDRLKRADELLEMSLTRRCRVNGELRRLGDEEVRDAVCEAWTQVIEARRALGEES